MTVAPISDFMDQLNAYTVVFLWHRFDPPSAFISFAREDHHHRQMPDVQVHVQHNKNDLASPCL